MTAGCARALLHQWGNSPLPAFPCPGTSASSLAPAWLSALVQSCPLPAQPLHTAGHLWRVLPSMERGPQARQELSKTLWVSPFSPGAA